MASEVGVLEDVAQAAAVLKPKRIAILKLLAEPRSCQEVGDALGESPQAIHYHIKALEKAGAVRKVEERPARGFVEAFYQATARQFWLSPDLVRLVGGKRKARAQLSMGYLVSLAEDVLRDVAALAQHEPEPATLGVSAQVALADPKQRHAFMDDVKRAIQRIATKYGATDGSGAEAYTMNLAVYPTTGGKR